jgi:hypothetical protein
MVLYTEKGNVLVGMILRLASILAAVILFVFGIVFYTQGKAGQDVQTRLLIIVFFSGIAPLGELVILNLLSLYVIQIAKVTPDEIVCMPMLAKWIPRLAWRVPIQTVNDAAVIEYNAVAERLEREGAGDGARITYFEEKGKNVDKSFLNAASVDGDGVSLRVRRFRGEKQGALLLLNNGSSLFLGFSDPAAAVAAIRQARGLMA